MPDWDGETQEFETLDELVRKMEEVRGHASPRRAAMSGSKVEVERQRSNWNSTQL